MNDKNIKENGKNGKNVLALFDFDGTIANEDTFIEFIKYTFGFKRSIWEFIKLSPFIILYLLRIISIGKLKEIIITHFFKGYLEEDFKRLALDFALQKMPQFIKQSAIKRLEWHKKRDDYIIVVSASIDYWLEAWCKLYDIELIASKLEIKNKRITGKFIGKDCNGEEKVRRIKQSLKLASFKYIYAYGNSNGDKPMLELADEKYYNYF